MSFTSNRKKTRKLLYQILFSEVYQKNSLDDFYNHFFDEVFSYDRDNSYIAEMLKIIHYREGFFIYVIKKFSPRFEFSQMSPINIIPVYIALAEMFYLSEEIPEKVSLNEAIEVAKVYGDNSSKKIVNGLLNSVTEHISELEDIKENYKDGTPETIFKT